MDSLGVDIDHFAVAAQMVLFPGDFLNGGGVVLEIVDFLLKRAVFRLHAIQIGTEANDFLLGARVLLIRRHDKDAGHDKDQHQQDIYDGCQDFSQSFSPHITLI